MNAHAEGQVPKTRKHRFACKDTKSQARCTHYHVFTATTAGFASEGREAAERTGMTILDDMDQLKKMVSKQEEERKKEGKRRPSCRSGTGSTFSIIAGVNEPGDFTCILVSIFGGQRRPTWLTNQQETNSKRTS